MQDEFLPSEQSAALLHGRMAQRSQPVGLAEQMETGGAKIEMTLQKMNCKYQTLFFLSSWCVVVGALIGGISSITLFKLATFVNSVFLLMFGIIMMVLDIPGSPRWAGKYRQNVRKFARFLTRLTGKSLWLLYLGCMIVVTLWPGRGSKRGTITVIVALVFSCFVCASSLIGLFIGMRKSLRLEKIRKAVLYNYKGNVGEIYRRHAITDPAHGMQFEEFNRMCSELTQGQVHFEIGDLAIIYNALDDHQKSAINEREFNEWLVGPITYL